MFISIPHRGYLAHFLHLMFQFDIFFSFYSVSGLPCILRLSLVLQLHFFFHISSFGRSLCTHWSQNHLQCNSLGQNHQCLLPTEIKKLSSIKDLFNKKSKHETIVNQSTCVAGSFPFIAFFLFLFPLSPLFRFPFFPFTELRSLSMTIFGLLAHSS